METTIRTINFDDHKDGVIEQMVLWGQKYNVKWALKQATMLLSGTVLVQKMKGLRVEEDMPVEVDEHEVLTRCYYLVLQPCNNYTNKECGEPMEFRIGTRKEDVNRAWRTLKRYFMDKGHLPKQDVHSVLEDEGFPDQGAFDRYMLFILGNRAKYERNIHGQLQYKKLSMHYVEAYKEEAAASKER